MKFFAIEGIFNNPLPIDKSEMGKVISDHMAYLEKGYNEGFILASGPKPAIDGGFILMKAESLEEVEEYFSKDPLIVTGVQKYHIVEFKLHKCLPEVSSWFEV